MFCYVGERNIGQQKCFDLWADEWNAVGSTAIPKFEIVEQAMVKDESDPRGDKKN
jgi:hypothetical protein